MDRYTAANHCSFAHSRLRYDGYAVAERARPSGINMALTPFRERQRLARLVLIRGNGEVVGVTRRYLLDEPWFQEVTSLIDQASAELGIEIQVIRLLAVTDEDLPVMRVDYIAQFEGDTPAGLEPSNHELRSHPLRPDYAELGGPKRLLDWAESELDRIGHKVVRRTQQRTWNLSSIWRLDTSSATFWVKAVPKFFAHEASVLTLFADHGETIMPRLVASRGSDMLLEHIPGEDAYNAGPEQMVHMARQLVELQWRWATRLDALRSAGVPNRGSEVLAATIPEVIRRHEFKMSDSRRDGLSRFVERLPQRLARLDDSGLPVTLVHGDYHPGNWRGSGLDLVMLDWGDCVIGNPLLDFPGLLHRAGEHAEVVREAWLTAWREKVPRADVETAAEIAVHLADARMAVVFQGFLDQIEPSEHIYHAADPGDFLARVAEAEPEAG